MIESLDEMNSDKALTDHKYGILQIELPNSAKECWKKMNVMWAAYSVDYFL